MGALKGLTPGVLRDTEPIPDVQHFQPCIRDEMAPSREREIPRFQIPRIAGKAAIFARLRAEVRRRHDSGIFESKQNKPQVTWANHLQLKHAQRSHKSSCCAWNIVEPQRWQKKKLLVGCCGFWSFFVGDLQVWLSFLFGRLTAWEAPNILVSCRFLEQGHCQPEIGRRC